jgi:hypothetical protein
MIDMKIVYFIAMIITLIAMLWLSSAVPTESDNWCVSTPSTYYSSLIPNSAYDWAHIIIVAGGILIIAFFATLGISDDIQPKPASEPEPQQQNYCPTCGQKLNGDVKKP